MKSKHYLKIIVLILAACAHAQVSVAPSPTAHMQFLDANGKPLASGKVFTYQAGTTTLQNAYLDAGGVNQNSDPIVLDGGGYADIWLANLSYKFCVYNSLNVLQYPCTDNITGYLGLLNLANTWTLLQTFTQPITDTLTDNQIVLGAGGNQTTLDAPPPTGNVTIHLPSTADTLVGRATTDTLTNKTLTTPLFNATNCGIINGPGTYVCIANQNPTGTTVSTLTKLVNAPSQAQISATTDGGAILGICVAGCGNTGTATIQTSGNANCVFDGATTAGDYVRVSSTQAGSCHDIGSVYVNTGGQILGRVLSTNVGAGTYAVALYPEVRTVFGMGCTDAQAGGCFPGASTLAGNDGPINLLATGTVPGTFSNLFRFSCYLIVTQAATVSSTLPSCSIAFIDADNSLAQTAQAAATNTGNTTSTFSQGSVIVRVKTGTTPTFSTAGYVSSGATPMQYTVQTAFLPVQ